jgi:hypothetical protein
MPRFIVVESCIPARACTDRLVIAEVEVDERNRGVGRGRVCGGAWRLVLFCFHVHGCMYAAGSDRWLTT